MEEIVIQINGGIMTNADVSVKNVMYMKKIMFEILLYVIVNVIVITIVLWMIHRLCGMKL